MKKHLLMVTTAFPYGHGESFVDAELAHLAATFDKVTLVPSFFTPGKPAREVTLDIDVGYAKARWGPARALHVASSFLRAMWQYRWLSEAVGILGKAQRTENAKELVRALYRASLFEQFLRLRHAAGEPVDVLYFYWIVPEIAGALAFRRSLRGAEAQRLKIVARAHGGDLYEELRPGRYAGLMCTVFSGLDEVYCISQHGKAYLDNKYPGFSRRFQLARLGVIDPGFINPQPAGNGLSILSCSFMLPGKRLHLIVEAIEFLARTNPDLLIHWTHIGDGELMNELQEKIRPLQCNPQVSVNFTGYLQQKKIVEYYRNAPFDVIVNVSDTEGIPVSLMEASSVGIPIVATDVGGNGEIVNGTNGMLVDKDADVATIARALLTFRDKHVSLSYRRQARAYWQSRFDAQRNYSRFSKALATTMVSP